MTILETSGSLDRPAPMLPTFVKPPRKPGFFERPGWPLTMGLMGFPIFWACGFGEFVWPIVAVPMAEQLWPRRRSLKVPPYFGMWLALLAWVVLGVSMLGQVLPGTLADSGGLIGWAVRVVNLLAATTVLLYLGNLSERDFPTRKVIRMLGFLFMVTVIGGLLGTFLGNVSWTSPFEYVLPQSIRHQQYVRSLIHPGFAQVENVLGFTSPRPKAPFAYTNTWGNNIAILLIWFVVGLVGSGLPPKPRRRRGRTGSGADPDHLFAQSRGVDRARHRACLRDRDVGAARPVRAAARHPRHSCHRGAGVHRHPAEPGRQRTAGPSAQQCHPRQPQQRCFRRRGEVADHGLGNHAFGARKPVVDRHR